MRVLKVIVMLVFCNYTQLSFAAMEQSLDLLMDCAVEMIEEQYDEGESVEVGLRLLTSGVDYDDLNQKLYVQCKKQLNVYRSSKNIRGLDYDELKSLASKSPLYASILSLLPQGATEKLNILSVKRHGLSVGLGLAVTCGFQKKTLSTALGRRFETKRVLFPLHTGLGIGFYSYKDPIGVVAGSYKSTISKNFFLEKKKIRSIEVEFLVIFALRLITVSLLKR